MTRRSGNWVPLTGLMRVWLTIWVLIWPALLVTAVDWMFGPAATVTSVTFLIAVVWAIARWHSVSKRIRTVRVPTRRRKARR